MTNIPPFHLAMPVNDIGKAREFYTTVLHCSEGRSTESWIDFDFYGHQLVVHYDPLHRGHNHENTVDGHSVPVPHYGVVLNWEDWHTLAEEMKRLKTSFIVEPYIRFEGEVGEQATMFFLDPSGNAIEFKACKDIGQLFAN
jgi:extradiol dioxygenase family protein